LAIRKHILDDGELIAGLGQLGLDAQPVGFEYSLLIEAPGRELLGSSRYFTIDCCDSSWL